jgi:hypothetical protein
METKTAQQPSATVLIPEAHEAAASRYIAAIVSRDVLASLGDEYVRSRTVELWHQFVTNYSSIAVGPYARHGADALRIALGRL